MTSGAATLKTAVPSRQKSERIPLDFGVARLLAPGGTKTSKSRRGEGYDAIVGLVSGTAAFTVEILGAPAVLNRQGGLEQPGTFVLLETIASVADAESGKQVALIDRQVRSTFVKARVTAGASKVEDIQHTIELIPIYAWRRIEGTFVISPTDIVLVSGSPGTIIDARADTAVGALATVALPVPPAGTRRMTIQNTGPSGSRIRVRQVGGPAGSGVLLTSLGSTSFGGADGAIAPVVAEDVTSAPGLATTVGITFERG